MIAWLATGSPSAASAAGVSQTLSWALETMGKTLGRRGPAARTLASAGSACQRMCPWAVSSAPDIGETTSSAPAWAVSDAVEALSQGR